MFKASAFAIVLCLSISLEAQRAPVPPPPAEGTQDAAHAAFSFERIETKVRFENDGSGRREQTFWIKVLDEQAVRQFGEFALAYQSESEDLAVTDVAVQKPDGTLVPTPPSSVQDLAAMPAGQLPIYVDVRQKVASITALRPGDVLRITGAWTLKKPIAPGQFWFEYSFDLSDIVADEQLEIDLPADRTVALKIAAGAPPEGHAGAGAVSGGRRIYHWKSSHPEIDPKPKTIQPGDEAPPADVRLSSFRSWDDLARWYTPLAIVAPDPAVKAKAEALTSGLTSDAAKIAAVYQFVSTEIRYVSLSFGLGRFAGHAPADVLRTQYGDCKDKAVLIRALLDAVGVRVVPVLINTTRSIGEDVPSPLEFNHMVAVAPAAASLDGTWMDATLEVAPLGMLSDITRDRRALALAGDGKGVLLRTPADSPVPSSNDLTIEGTVNGIGVLDARVTLLVRGDGELVARALIRSMPRTVLKEFAARVAALSGIDGEVSEPATSDPADTRAPFRLSYRVRSKGFLDWASARSVLSVRARDTLPYDSADERKDLRRLHFASTYSSRVRATIDLPPGYEATPPQPLRVARAGLTYASTYTVAGARLTVERTTAIAVRDVPEKDFGEYSTLVAAVDADVKQQFSVRASTTGVPSIPADATADEVYKAGQAAWDARRYEAAVPMYKQATELAPKMGAAWVALGLAYERLGKYEEAIAALRKQIELDPFNKRVYGDLGYVLEKADKDDEAIKAYLRDTELNPLDGVAFKRLGQVYVNVHQFTEAIPVLDKALGLLPREAWVPANLVQAYLATQQPEKARQALDRVMERQPSADVRSFVSWHLAQNGFELDRADEIARGAERDLLAGLHDVDAASLTDARFDRVERLGWAWDAIGWTAFQRGNLTEADAYVRAAWQMLGDPDIAFHLGRVCEKRDKLADAMSYYLTAQALDSKPSADLVARVKKLAGGGDLPKMLESARQSASVEHSFRMPGAAAGQAQFVAIVDNTRKAIDVRFLAGDEALKPLAQQALRSVTLPVLFPASAPARIPVSLRVRCTGGQCVGAVELPKDVTLPASSGS